MRKLLNFHFFAFWSESERKSERTTQGGDFPARERGRDERRIERNDGETKGEVEFEEEEVVVVVCHDGEFDRRDGASAHSYLRQREPQEKTVREASERRVT